MTKDNNDGDIKELQRLVVDWANRVFPERLASNAIMKLFEEIGEWVRDPHCAAEFADIVIILLDLAYLHGIDIAAAVREKMVINKAREWRLNEQTGVMSHVKEQA